MRLRPDPKRLSLAAKSCASVNPRGASLKRQLSPPFKPRPAATIRSSASHVRRPNAQRSFAGERNEIVAHELARRASSPFRPSPSEAAVRFGRSWSELCLHGRHPPGFPGRRITATIGLSDLRDEL